MISLSPVFGVIIVDVEHEGFSLVVVFGVGYPLDIGVLTIGVGLGLFGLT